MNGRTSKAGAKPKGAGPASGHGGQNWKGKARAAARAPEADPENARAPAGAAAPAGENGPEPASGHGGQKPAGTEAGRQKFRAEPAGAGGEAPKRPKFHAKSQQERVSEAKIRMEKRGGKLEKAQEKLARQKPPKKPGPVKRAGQVAKGEAWAFVHGKIYEAEHENVGIEGAHRSELAGEAVLRTGSRHIRRKIREHPAKAVRKAERKYVKATAEHNYRVAVQERPELEKKTLSRLFQKQRLKRQYAKQAKEAAKTGAKAAEKTAVTTERLAARTVAFVKRHPVGFLILLACALLIVALQSCTSSMVTIGNGTISAIAASTYPAEEVDLRGAEAAYCALEAELQHYLDTYTSTHDYDEYHFDLDDIEHDPYVLLSMISAWHEGDWTLAEVEPTLQMFFDRQYKIG